MRVISGTYDQLTDEALCKQVAAGDRIAEETLVMRYNRLVRMCARPYFLAGGDSEDLIQEGMLGLLAAIREYTPERELPFSAYARICIRNRLLSAVRAAKRKKHIPLNHSVSFETPLFDSDPPCAFHGAPVLQDSDPEEVLIDREDQQERITSLKDCLSGFETKILQLYLDGLSYDEIAAEVGRSPKSVDNAVQRIRRKLARQI